jgi:hypothetical protein
VGRPGLLRDVRQRSGLKEETIPQRLKPVPFFGQRTAVLKDRADAFAVKEIPRAMPGGFLVFCGEMFSVIVRFRSM